MKEDEFHKILKSKLDDYEIMTNTESWSSIEDELNRVDKKQRNQLLLRYAIAASVVLLLSAGGAFFWLDKSIETDHIVENPQITTTPAIINSDGNKALQEIIIPETFIEKTSTNPIYTNTNKGKVELAVVTNTAFAENKILTTDSSENNSDSVISITDLGESALANSTSSLTSNSEKQPTKTTDKNTVNLWDNRYDDIHVVKTKKKGNLALALNLSSVPSNSTDKSPDTYRAFDSESGSFEIYSIPKPTYEMDHNKPITVGASVRKDINKSLAIESGLTYTYLYSKSKNSYLREKQQLHYIGIPVNLIVKAKQWGNFSIYLSGGGAVKKNIAGQFSTENTSYANQRTITKNYTTKSLQWSVDAKLGLDYRFYKQLSIYAEPGWAYYFSNSGSFQTIWTEQPSQFSFQFGLRLNIN